MKQSNKIVLTVLFAILAGVVSFTPSLATSMHNGDVQDQTYCDLFNAGKAADDAEYQARQAYYACEENCQDEWDAFTQARTNNGGGTGDGTTGNKELTGLISSPWYYIGAALCLLVLAIVAVVIVIRMIRRRGGGRVLARGSQARESVQDDQGNWWHQEPATGRWLLWNGRAWQPTEHRDAPPTPAAPSRGWYSPRSAGGGCGTTIIMVILCGVVVLGGFTLVYLGFFPNQSIQPAAVSNMTEILKLGGIGILVTIAGAFTYRGGLTAIRTKRAVVEDEYGGRSERTGCFAVMTGISQTLFGIGLVLAGFALIGLAVTQHIMPWLLGL